MDAELIDITHCTDEFFTAIFAAMAIARGERFVDLPDFARMNRADFEAAKQAYEKERGEDPALHVRMEWGSFERAFFDTSRDHTKAA